MVNHGKTIVFWFALIFTFSVSFQISAGIAKERITLPGRTPASENTVIIIRSPQIAAYNEVIKGYEEGCKGKIISEATAVAGKFKFNLIKTEVLSEKEVVSA